MKTRILSLATAAIACTAAAQYTYQQMFQNAVDGLTPSVVFGGSTDFESIGMDDAFFAGNTADAFIATDATVATAIPAANRPANYPYADTRDKILSVDAPADTPLFRDLNADGNAPQAASIYADMLIQGDVHKWDEAILPTSADDKILVYFKETAENGAVVGTNLYVCAGAVNDQWDGVLPHEYKLATPGVASIEANAWYRIVIVSLLDVGGLGAGFQIYLGGYGPDYLCTGPGVWHEDAQEFDPDDGMDTRFLSLCAVLGGGGGMMASVGFSGSVSVDDFVVSTINPAQVAVTLSWPAGIRDPYCVIGTETNSLAGVTSPLALQVPAGTEVGLGGDTDYRQFAESLTASGAGASLSLPEQGILWYFPQTNTPDQDGSADHPFEIATPFDLFALADAVSAGFGADLCYTQVDDIDMLSEGEFPGIGTYNADPRLGKPFSGTYDGGNYAISDITFTARNYGGIFNQVNGGTIKNLVVENISAPADATGEYGYAIVGNAGNGAKLLNLTSTGSFGSAEKPGSHNMAGIVVRACGGGEDGTLVQGCVNQASIYGSYTKIGGICAITQHKVDGAPITFDICGNQGSLVSSRTSTGVTGYAGIVGYVDDDTVLENCFGTGAVVNGNGANTDCDGALVGWAYSYSLTDNGGNSAPADTKMVGKYRANCTVTGFQFAAVDNGVATTVLPPLDSGDTYLLEGNVPASAEPVATLAAEGDTIAFDTALGYTFDGAVAAGNGLALSCETNGTVILYTACELAYPSYLADADAGILGAYDVWKAAHEVADGEPYEKQFLLNVMPGTEVADDDLEIVSFTANGTGGWDVVVASRAAGAAFSGTPGTARVANGYLAVGTSDDLADWTWRNLDIAASSGGRVTVSVDAASDVALMKVRLSVLPEPQE